MTAKYKEKEQLDRESYAQIPLPRGRGWIKYIDHRMKMFPSGMRAYARRRYKRLDFDAYVEKNRRMDTIAKFLTNNKPTLVMRGGGDMHHNACIGVRRSLRIRAAEFQPKRLESKKMYFEKKWPLTLLDELPEEAPIEELFMDGVDGYDSYWAWYKWIYPEMQVDIYSEKDPEPAFDKATQKKYWDIYKKCYDILKKEMVDGFKIIWHRDIAAARCILYVGE